MNNKTHLPYIWVNYHISLPWILRPFGDDFPNPNHDLQWGKTVRSWSNLPRYIPIWRFPIWNMKRSPQSARFSKGMSPRWFWKPWKPRRTIDRSIDHKNDGFTMLYLKKMVILHSKLLNYQRLYILYIVPLFHIYQLYHTLSTTINGH